MRAVNDNSATRIGSGQLSLLCGRVDLFASRVGLDASEVERLIGVRCGVWPMTAARCEFWLPSDRQLQRLRALLQVCGSASSLMGRNAAAWFRAENVGLGCSPVDFLLSEPQALTVLRDVLRQELGW